MLRSLRPDGEGGDVETEGTVSKRSRPGPIGEGYNKDHEEDIDEMFVLPDKTPSQEIE